MKKEKKSHFNLWIYIIIIVCILSSSIAYSALNASVKITADVVIEQPTNILYEMMRKSSVMDNIQSDYVSSSTGINFKAISSNTNGKGVYERKGTENQQYPIYYYRGEVDNNNVLFANYCWKIVRTTETGGIKLIFNGTPSSSNACNNTGTASQLTVKAFNINYDSLSQVGYRYGTFYGYKQGTVNGAIYGSSVSYGNGNYTVNNTSNTIDNNHHYSCGTSSSTCSTVRYYYAKDYYINLTSGDTIESALNNMFSNKSDSTIKNYIENTWYKEHMTNYSDKLEDTVWCTDRSLADAAGWNPNGGNLNGTLYFGGDARNKAGTPAITCSREEDRLTVANGGVKYKVGLLTSDEVLLAGGQTITNNNYFLNIGSYYWLGSPYTTNNICPGGYNVSDGGLLGYSYGIYREHGVRPAISLNHDSTFNGGDGTANSPYIID